ncbi:MAG: hypothetical protein K2K97_00945, partial [Muribaculaceae bacterium]|nr:hypothetical protein [Muribaculaceae bacterium]
MSGNEEHYSLESLRMNFVWEDVKKLFDGGRFDKWLRRIGANEIADRIQGLKHPQDNLLEVYNILFRGDKPFKTVKELIQEYFDGAKELGSIAKMVVSSLEVADLIQISKQYDDEKIKFEEALIAVADRADSNITNDQLFNIGKILANKENYRQQAIKYIKSASKAGLEEAKECLCELCPDETIIERATE